MDSITELLLGFIAEYGSDFFLCSFVIGGTLMTAWLATDEDMCVGGEEID